MKQFKNLAIIIFSILLVSCGQKHSIEANIVGLGNDTIFARYLSVDESLITDDWHKDTIIVKDGRFYYDSPSERPILIYMVPKKGGFKSVRGKMVYPPQKHIELLLKKDDKIKIVGKLEDYYIDYKATGNDFNEDYSQFRKGTIAEFSKGVKIKMQLDTISDLQEDLIKKLLDEERLINNFELKKRLDFVKKNWNKDLSVYLLTLYPYGDTLDTYYKNLTVNVSTGTFKHMLEEQVKMNIKDRSIHSFQSKAAIGLVAPNFELKALDGTNFSLNSLGDDKIIILDFWGSWCGWCVKGFPKMKTYYEKYKNKMEIIGIANRDTETAWEKSVHENNLTWIQVINDQKGEINKDVPTAYGVKGYPTKFILDRDKKILAIFVGETEEFYRKLDEIFKN